MFEDNRLFVTADKKRVIKKYYTISHSIPHVLYEKSETANSDLNSFDNRISAVKSVVTGSVALSLLFYLFFSVSMRKLWLLISTT